MRHNNYLILVYPFVVIAVAIQLWIAANAFGGIDVDRYYLFSYAIDYSIPRYFKEPISWELVRFLSIFTDRDSFLLGVAVLVLAMSVLLLGWLRGLILYAAFLSPFGILLELNVLRQCFGTLFMSIAFYHLVGDRQKLAIFFSVAAILCHTSSVFTISMVFLVFYMDRIPLVWRAAIVFGGICAFVGLQTFGLLAVLADLSTSTAADFTAVIDDGPENMLYAVASLLLCLPLYLLGDTRNLKLASIGLALSSLAAVGICELLSMDAWVYGRISMGNAIIGSFLLLQHLILRKQSSASDAMIAFSLLALNGMLIFVHPGAMSMIQGM